MRIYADESVNVAIVEGLKRRGIDAFSAKDIDKLGLTDALLVGDLVHEGVLKVFKVEERDIVDGLLIQCLVACMKIGII